MPLQHGGDGDEAGTGERPARARFVALALVFTSVVMDQVRARLLYAVLLAGWSCATGLQAAARGFAGFLGLRLGVGALEAPSFPINNKVITGWFPQRERARAISTYISGQFVGMAFLTPVLAYLQAEHGWRAVFLVT